MHTCPMVTPGTPPVPHVGGPVTGPGMPTVLIGGMPAAVMGDMCVCVGPPDTIIMGSVGVFIGGKPAARMGDPTAHGGVVSMGCPTVLIGEVAPGTPQPPVMPLPMKVAMLQMTPKNVAIAGQRATLKTAAVQGTPFCKKCAEKAMAEIKEKLAEQVQALKNLYNKAQNYLTLLSIAQKVNPDNGNINCGKIIDAVIDRLKNPDSKAVADTEPNGSFSEIETRHNTTITWGKSFQDIFQDVKNGGNGTTGIIGVIYGNNTSSHVIVITNKNGVVGIIEGQLGGKVITSPEKADKLYNSDGKSRMGLGITK